MSAEPERWQEAKRAWERLAVWLHDPPSAIAGHPLDGDQALKALTDIGALRRLLDQMEFETVRTSRRYGKSWAEIAIRLGVARQSAWERWRVVDEPDEPVGEPDAESAAVSAPSARRRRASSVVVPNVIGMSWEQAWRVLHGLGLVAVGSDPDGPPPDESSWPDGVVTDQSPESGAKVPPGSAVRLWVDRGGGSGVREPRRPPPGPKPALKMRDETVDQAVG